jgi:aspartate kinase
MALIVQKFGGTSVADLDRIRNVARRLQRDRAAGHQLVVVVSARAGVTNRLLADAKLLNPDPDPRELDMLLAVGEQETIALTAMALQNLGIPAVSRTGAQAGILTDDAHTRSRIMSISGGDIHAQLNAGKIVIVAGFQGETPHRHTTTLGRGGSDLTAIALASVAQGRCLPDLSPTSTASTPPTRGRARLPASSRRSATTRCSSSPRLGSKVMQARSVEFAKKHGVPFEVRSSFNDNPGTLVKEEVSSMEDVVVRGVALDKNQIKVTVTQPPDKPGSAAAIFQALADAKINVDMIIQNVGRGGLANLTFTVPRDDVRRVERPCRRPVLKKIDGGEVEVADRDRQALRGRRRHAHPFRAWRHDSVQGAGRPRHEHPDDQHLRNQDLGGASMSPARTKPPGSSTTPSSSANWTL